MVECRALLDSGSQSNFVTESCIKRLNIPKQETNISVMGIGPNPVVIRKNCTINIKSRTLNYSSDLAFLIVSQLNHHQLDLSSSVKSLKIPANIKLADPEFANFTQVDMILGAEIFYSLLCIGQIKLGTNLPTLQKTKLGWIISGPITYTYMHLSICNLRVSHTKTIEHQLARFWEIEEVATTNSILHKSQICEQHFTDTTQRDANGRFIVFILFREHTKLLGESKSIAINRLLSIKKRFAKDSNFRKQYHDFMREYISLNHMSLIDDEINDNPKYYLPHHGVIGKDSSTTKLRVVFDGSANTSTRFSLNDIQHVGPVVQNDLLSILIQFCYALIVFSADLQKMYSQVLIKNDQCSLQRIVWRFGLTPSIETYQLNIVIYGTASASYLASRARKQLAFENREKHKTAAEVIERDFYVDDLLSGANSVQSTVSICNKINSILQQSWFSLRKGFCNQPRVLNLLNLPQNCIMSGAVNFAAHEQTKILGLLFSATTDQILFTTDRLKLPTKISKRTILSYIAQIFDPLCLLSVTTIVSKIIIQKLWLAKISWDKSIPLDIHTIWENFKKDLGHLNSLKIPRRIICDSSVEVELHGFSDASTSAYGSCIYIRNVNNAGSASVHLLCAKSKVAPLKTLTVPRLELCGSLTLARFYKMVLDSSNVNVRKAYLWTDSSVTLAWIKTSSHLLKSFVSHRVSEIQTFTNSCHWRHINGEHNPADLLSRDISPKQFIENIVWWNGLSWLSMYEES